MNRLQTQAGISALLGLPLAFCLYIIYTTNNFLPIFAAAVFLVTQIVFFTYWFSPLRVLNNIVVIVGLTLSLVLVFGGFLAFRLLPTAMLPTIASLLLAASFIFYLLFARPNHVPFSTPVEDGDIWWVDFPFTDSLKSKDRPCIVLATTTRGAKVLKVTSTDQSNRQGYVSAKLPGLDKRTSWVQVDKVYKIPAVKFRRRAGSLTNRELSYLKQNLR